MPTQLAPATCRCPSVASWADALNGREGPPAPADALAVLGEGLVRRADEVVAALRRRTAEHGSELHGGIEATFDSTARVSTVAVGRWIAGASPEDARIAGWDATRSFGQLAAQRSAALHEVTKRCLRWRDSAAEVLLDEAARLGTRADVTGMALDMLRHSFDVTLVRVGEAFEVERKRLQDELIERESKLAFQATHDSLTGLPNRLLILDRVRQALVRSRHAQTPVAVMFIDLDNFKYVNDAYGHGAGDRLLCAVASRLQGLVGDADTLGRLGGDEFVMVIEGLSLFAGPERIAQRVLDALALHPFAVDGTRDATFTITASVGIATGERSSAEDLLRDADIALYQAKWAGRNGAVVFDPEMGRAAQRHLALEMELRHAVRDEQFFLVYQPILDLEHMRTTGVEVLLRWQHPTRGVIAPTEFVPLLEELNLIGALGTWVLDAACREGRAWHAAGHPIDVSVNVSARQFDAGDFADSLAGILSRTGYPADRLVLEITESCLARDAKATTRHLDDLKQLGVRIAIDDFGTGYSSLDQLRELPVDILKIDKSFVARMLRDQQGTTLTRALLEIGRALGIETLAEGIESDRQLEHLRREGCTSGQGFLFAHPLAAEHVERFLADERRSAHTLATVSPLR